MQLVHNPDFAVGLGGSVRTGIAAVPEDADGVIVIPERIAAKVLAEAERLTAREVRIRRELERGATLKEMLKKYGHV